jgi:hypothetical protein
MSFKEVAIALEADAQVRGYEEKLETIYSYYDRLITKKAGSPYIVAWINFIRGGDIQVRQLAALWLYRHDHGGQEPEISPELGAMLDQAIIDVIREVVPLPSSRQEK